LLHPYLPVDDDGYTPQVLDHSKNLFVENGSMIALRDAVGEYHEEESV
jgi:hypothetical protein